MDQNNTLLSIKGLKTEFRLKEGRVLRAIDGIDLDIKPGEIHGLVLQHPFDMCYTAVKTMVQHLRGRKVKKRIDTGCEVITPENMDQPRQKELLTPDLSKWLEN